MHKILPLINILLVVNKINTQIKSTPETLTFIPPNKDLKEFLPLDSFSILSWATKIPKYTMTKMFYLDNQNRHRQWSPHNNYVKIAINVSFINMSFEKLLFRNSNQISQKNNRIEFYSSWIRKGLMNPIGNSTVIYLGQWIMPIQKVLVKH